MNINKIQLRGEYSYPFQKHRNDGVSFTSKAGLAAAQKKYISNKLFNLDYDTLVTRITNTAEAPDIVTKRQAKTKLIQNEVTNDIRTAIVSKDSEIERLNAELDSNILESGRINLQLKNLKEIRDIRFKLSDSYETELKRQSYAEKIKLMGEKKNLTPAEKQVFAEVKRMAAEFNKQNPTVSDIDKKMGPIKNLLNFDKIYAEKLEQIQKKSVLSKADKQKLSEYSNKLADLKSKRVFMKLKKSNFMKTANNEAMISDLTQKINELKNKDGSKRQLTEKLLMQKQKIQKLLKVKNPETGKTRKQTLESQLSILEQKKQKLIAKDNGVSRLDAQISQFQEKQFALELAIDKTPKRIKNLEKSVKSLGKELKGTLKNQKRGLEKFFNSDADLKIKYDSVPVKTYTLEETAKYEAHKLQSEADREASILAAIKNEKIKEIETKISEKSSITSDLRQKFNECQHKLSGGDSKNFNITNIKQRDQKIKDLAEALSHSERKLATDKIISEGRTETETVGLLEQLTNLTGKIKLSESLEEKAALKRELAKIKRQINAVQAEQAKIKVQMEQVHQETLPLRKEVDSLKYGTANDEVFSL